MKDEFGNINLFKEKECPICKKLGKFINLGSEKEEWLCPNCKTKTSNEYRLIQTRFGYYWRKSDKNEKTGNN